jgi:hypothetical protein
MSCAQCRHENRPDASYCNECGYPLLSLWPQADLRPRPTRPRARRPRRPSRLIEIAAAVAVVVTGLSVISGIVLASPRWQRIIASWQGSDTTRASGMTPAFDSAIEPARSLVIEGGAAQGVAPAPPRLAAEPPSPRPAPARPAYDSAPTVDRAPLRAQPESAQVMASLLVSQLGFDPAWRTALANADAVSTDSPEYGFWRAVAAAIRDGAAVRARP